MSNLSVLNQQTLNRAANFSGIGLHSGNRVNMSILPAAGNSGFVFRRTDLDGKPEVEARVENISITNRSTTLAKGNVKIHTVEHVLAALAGLGVDNAVIELDANEPPIADGSSRDFTAVIKAAGLKELPEKKEFITLTEPIELRTDDTLMTVFPDENFRITCTSTDKRNRFTQFYSTEVTPKIWEKELCHARTFVFFEELEYLFKNGLIKGGSLESAIVIRDDAVLTTEPLRYPEEFVRHKIMDIIGDLALLGKSLKAHVVAVRPGHSANCELAKKILEQLNRPARVAQALTPPPAPGKPAPEPPPTADGAMDINAVMKFLPHRYPFLLVDRVLSMNDKKIIALKNVTINEPFFQGHFPGHPIMPGVLQLEAMAQVGGLLMMQNSVPGKQIAYFMSAEDVKWRKPVLPGDSLVIEVDMMKSRGKICKAKGVCKVNGDVVSEAEVTFMLRDV
ncbi:MAG TPA: bifunctional UDP-3-O-[3-hydroxymyristoyl] N-acetylglucosamine deacetylase/3-hydroxyacyl-ACP dehydratase [Verrucomicrobiae bacterium]|nr:bifunctional UDP-3-O-[3-hydroxymyristoyl] N-acetylglucosamine deacetylase/3-hydroxyacyl-ACP dehydratase [Verrucomicrobiae bacterium]